MKKRVFIYILIWILGCVCGSGVVYLKFNQASVRMEVKEGETRLIEFGDAFPIDEIYAMKEKKFEKNKMDKLKCWRKTG